MVSQPLFPDIWTGQSTNTNIQIQIYMAINKLREIATNKDMEINKFKFMNVAINKEKK